jgi:hypothetical protein
MRNASVRVDFLDRCSLQLLVHVFLERCFGGMLIFFHTSKGGRGRSIEMFAAAGMRGIVQSYCCGVSRNTWPHAHRGCIWVRLGTRETDSWHCSANGGWLQY